MAENVFSTEAIANALESREQQLRQQRRRDDAEEIARDLFNKVDQVAHRRVYGTSSQEVVNANPQPANNSAAATAQPAQQGEGQQQPDPLVALAAIEFAKSETVEVNELHRKAQELASMNGRDPGRVANELAARVQQLRGETGNTPASQQGNPRVPGSRVVKNLLSRDDDNR